MIFFRHGSGASCFVVLCLSINPVQAASSDFAENSPRVVADIFSKYDGAKAIFGTGVFAPLFSQDGSILFLDASFSAAQSDFHTASIGVGYRLQRAWGVLGLNAFFDVGQTEFSSVRNQIGLGAEFASGRFRLGINGYLPLDNREDALGASSARIVGNELRLFGGEEHFLKGFDLEFGVLAASFAMESLTAEIWANGQLESFHSDVLGVQNGASIGLEAVVHPTDMGLYRSTLKLQVTAQWDEQTDDLALAAGFNVNVALGAAGAGSNIERDAETDVLTNRVRRRHGIKTVAAATGFSELTYDNDTDVALDTVYQVSDQAGLVAALANQNALVIVDAMSSSYTPIVLNGDITVMGGSSGIELRGQHSGNVVSFTAPGSRPSVNVPFQDTGIGIIGDNNHVAGFDVIGSGGALSFFGGVGIAVATGSNNIVIEQNYLSDNPTGISVGPFGRDYVFRNNTIENAVIGFNLSGNQYNLLIEDNRIGNLYQSFAAWGTGIAVSTNLVPALSALEPITIQGNQFFGTIEGEIIRVSGQGYTLAGTGNSSTAVGLNNTGVVLCSNGGSGIFNGTVAFDIGIAADTLIDCP